MTAEPALRNEPAQDDDDLPLFDAADLPLPPPLEALAPGNAERIHRVSVWPGRMIDLVHHKLADTRFALEDGHVRVEPKRGPAILLVDFADATQSPRPPVMVFKGGEKVEAAPFLEWLRAWDPEAETPDYASLFGTAPTPKKRPRGADKNAEDQIDMFGAATAETEIEDTPPAPADAETSAEAETSESPAPGAAGVLRFPEITFESAIDQDADADLSKLDPIRDLVPEGAAFSLISGPARGILVFDPAGEFRFTPEPGYTGIARFTCRVTAPDGQMGIAEIGVAVGVSAPDAPTPEPEDHPEEEDIFDLSAELMIQSEPEVTLPGAETEPEPEPAPRPRIEAPNLWVVTQAATPVGGNLLEDAGIGSAELTVALAEPAAHGFVLMTAAGDCAYTPMDGFTGTDSFSYRLDHVSGASATAIVSIRVEDAEIALPEDDEPETTALGEERSDLPAVVPPPPEARVPEVLRGPAPDTRAVRVTLAAGARYGTVVVDPEGAFTYMPNPDYQGTDSFSYRMTGPGGADLGTGDIALFIGISAPISANEAANEEGPPAGCFVTYPGRAVSGAIMPAEEGQAQEVVLPEEISEPEPDFLPSPEILEDPLPETALPEDIEPEDEPLSPGIEIVAGPDHGYAELDEEGGFTYTPDPGFAGRDTFLCRIVGGDGSVETTLVAVDVDDRGAVDVSLEAGPEPDPASAEDIAAEDEPVTEDGIGSVVLTDDRDAAEEGDDQPIVPENEDVPAEDSDLTMLIEVPDYDEAAGTALAVSEPPSHGSLRHAPEGFTYTPAAGYTGPDRFAYELTDTTGRRETSVVELMIDPQVPDGVSDQAGLHDVWHVAAE